MIVFTKVHRLGCLLRERISLATLSFYNVISKSLHTRTFCPWRKQKKNRLLSIWPLTPTRASGLFSSPFDCTCALVETIFPLGVSHSLSERTCLQYCIKCVCVDCIAECVHDVRRAKSYSHALWHTHVHGRSFSHHRRITFVREWRGTSSGQNVEN